MSQPTPSSSEPLTIHNPEWSTKGYEARYLSNNVAHRLNRSVFLEFPNVNDYYRMRAYFYRMRVDFYPNLDYLKLSYYNRVCARPESTND